MGFSSCGARRKGHESDSDSDHPLHGWGFSSPAWDTPYKLPRSVVTGGLPVDATEMGLVKGASVVSTLPAAAGHALSGRQRKCDCHQTAQKSCTQKYIRQCGHATTFICALCDDCQPGTLWKHTLREMTGAHSNHICTTALIEL